MNCKEQIAKYFRGNKFGQPTISRLKNVRIQGPSTIGTSKKWLRMSLCLAHSQNLTQAMRFQGFERHQVHGTQNTTYRVQN